MFRAFEANIKMAKKTLTHGTRLLFLIAVKFRVAKFARADLYHAIISVTKRSECFLRILMQKEIF